MPSRPLINGRRTRAFADLLERPDAGLDLVQDEVSPALVQALRSLGRQADELAAPGADYRRVLRNRLVAVAAVAPHTAPARARRSTQRRMTVLVGSLAGTVALAGVGTAAQQSLPGDPLHPLERGIDNVRMAFGGPETTRAVVAQRMDEVASLAARGAAASTVSSALDDVDDLAWQAAAEAGPVGTADTRSMAREQLGRLTSLMPTLPLAAKPAARGLADSLGAMARGLLAPPVPGTPPPGVDPPAVSTPSQQGSPGQDHPGVPSLPAVPSSPAGGPTAVPVLPDAGSSADPAEPVSPGPLPSRSVPGLPLPTAPLPAAPLPTAPLPTAPLPAAPLPSVPLPAVPLPATSVPPPSVPSSGQLPSSVPLPPVPLPPLPPLFLPAAPAPLPLDDVVAPLRDAVDLLPLSRQTSEGAIAP